MRKSLTLTLDDKGNIIVAGPLVDGGQELFVSKYDPDGALLWQHHIDRGGARRALTPVPPPPDSMPPPAPRHARFRRNTVMRVIGIGAACLMFMAVAGVATAGRVSGTAQALATAAAAARHVPVRAAKLGTAEPRLVTLERIELPQPDQLPPGSLLDELGQDENISDIEPALPAAPTALPAAAPAAVVPTVAAAPPTVAAAAKVAAAPAVAAPAVATAAGPVPGSAAALRAETLEYLGKRQLVAALLAARAYVHADPTDAHAYLCMGAALQDLGRTEEAREAFSACVQTATRGDIRECRSLGGR